MCINQNSLEERAQQVMLMGQIYSTAQEVFVWLGKPNKYFDDFYWVMTTLMPKLEKLDWNDILPYGPMDSELLRNLVFTGYTDVTFWVEKLLGYSSYHRTTRWFSRTWVVQEITNANHIRICCGEFEIPWSRIVLMSTIDRKTGWILTMQRLAQIKPLDIFASDGMHADQWQELREICIGVKHSGLKALPEFFSKASGCQSDDALGYRWLFFVMTALKNTHCQDARDLVYASLSMATYVFPTDILQWRPLRPDYSLENLVADVFTDITKVIMCYTNSVNYLCWAGIGNGRDLLGIPSWVPEYSAGVIAAPMPVFRGFMNFDSSKSRDSAGTQLDIDGSKLTLHGAAAFDSVEDVCSLPGTEFITSHALHEMLAFCSNLPELFHGQTKAEVL